jgi:lipopolysaccharide export system permease protein
MTLIEKYLFRQLLGPVLGALAALTAVAVLSQSLSALDIIVERGQSPWVLAKLTVLALPQVLSLVVPIGVFVGSLLALNRLQTEQEIVVCFAGGMSRWRVISPAIRLATLVALASLFLNVWVQPVAYRTMRHELYRVKTDLAATLVREGEFTEAGGGLTVYTQAIDQNGLLRNVFIHVKKPDGATVYTAQEGRIVKRSDSPVLILRRGSSQEFARSGVLNFLSFDEYAFDLSPFVTTDEVFRYKASDRWLHELLFPNKTFEWERKNVNKLAAEAHARLSAPLYNFSFMALALAGVIGGPFSRLGYGRRIARVAAIAAVARIVGFGVQAACAGNVWLNVLQYLVPLAPLVYASRTIFAQKVRRYVPRASDQGSFLPKPSAP